MTNDFSRMVARRIEELRPRKTQARIAQEIGFDQRNALSNLKSGRMKVPVDRLPAIATALELDPLEVVRVWLRSNPRVATMIEMLYGGVPTSEEVATLTGLREGRLVVHAVEVAG